jgi:hypothetical protein
MTITSTPSLQAVIENAAALSQFLQAYIGSTRESPLMIANVCEGYASNQANVWPIMKHLETSMNGMQIPGADALYWTENIAASTMLVEAETLTKDIRRIYECLTGSSSTDEQLKTSEILNIVGESMSVALHGLATTAPIAAATFSPLGQRTCPHYP